jgi:hypothetical protein
METVLDYRADRANPEEAGRIGRPPHLRPLRLHDGSINKVDASGSNRRSAL